MLFTASPFASFRRRWPEALHHSYFPWCSLSHVPSTALMHVTCPLMLLKVSMMSRHHHIAPRQTRSQSLKITWVIGCKALHNKPVPISSISAISYQKVCTYIIYAPELFCPTFFFTCAIYCTYAYSMSSHVDENEYGVTTLSRWVTLNAFWIFKGVHGVLQCSS